jgi:hypothetical protein
MQHRKMRGDVGLERGGIEAQRLIAHRCELGARPGVPAREQRHIVAQRHERFGQVRDHAFGATVQPRRYRLA